MHTKLSIIKLSEEQASSMFYPELTIQEKSLYYYRKISDIEQVETDIIIICGVIKLNDIHTFDRDNDNIGSVRNIQIADDTGSIKVVLANDNTNMDLEIGIPMNF